MQWRFRSNRLEKPLYKHLQDTVLGFYWILQAPIGNHMYIYKLIVQPSRHLNVKEIQIFQQKATNNINNNIKSAVTFMAAGLTCMDFYSWFYFYSLVVYHWMAWNILDLIHHLGHETDWKLSSVILHFAWEVKLNVTFIQYWPYTRPSELHVKCSTLVQSHDQYSTLLELHKVPGAT